MRSEREGKRDRERKREKEIERQRERESERDRYVYLSISLALLLAIVLSRSTIIDEKREQGQEKEWVRESDVSMGRLWLVGSIKL